MFELQDLRPSPGGRQPRGVSDCTTVVISDANKIAGGSQNEGSSSLMRSLVEMNPKIVKLTKEAMEARQPVQPGPRVNTSGLSAQHP